MSRARLWIAAIFAVMALLGYYGYREVNPITGDTQHISMSREDEVALGMASAPQVAEEFGGLDPDPELQARVNAIGARVVRGSVAGQTPYPFEFHVLQDPQTVNAFALPGGPVFVTRGLLDRLQNEGQLAGVLGHEVGHVLGRHSAEQIARGRLAEALTGAAGIAASDDYNDARRAQAVAALAARIVQLRYGREDEIQADTLGVRLMIESGFDPHDLLGVMRILKEASGGSRQPEFLSTHPDPGNRETVIRDAIARREGLAAAGDRTTRGR